MAAIRKRIVGWAAFSVAMELLLVVGLIGFLIGPNTLRFISPIAFVTTAIFWFPRLQADYSQNPDWPKAGLSHFYPKLQRWRTAHEYLAGAVFAVALASLAVFFVTAGRAGGPDGTRPVFERQQRYHLVLQGQSTPVARSRYVVVGASAFTSWHCLAFVFALVSQHFIVFGHYPRWFGHAEPD